MSEASATGGVSGVGWKENTRGWRVRVYVSILASTAWLCVTLLYLGFGGTGFSLFQSLIVLFVSLLILGALLGMMWVSFGAHESG